MLRAQREDNVFQGEIDARSDEDGTVDDRGNLGLERKNVLLLRLG